MLEPTLPARQIRIVDSGGGEFIYHRDPFERRDWYLSHANGEKIDPEPLSASDLRRIVEQVLE